MSVPVGVPVGVPVWRLSLGEGGAPGTVLDTVPDTVLDAAPNVVPAASIAAPADRTVLRAALDAGIELPSSCRNGTCRACMRQLKSGQVRYLIEWPGLSADEKDEGWILPCVAYPLSDLVLC